MNEPFLEKASPKTVRIPFLRQFKKPMLDGTKTMTSRTTKYGEVGDTFEAFGTTFQIIEVKKATLGFIAHYLHVAEGFESQEAFLELWRQLHPIRHNLNDLFWVHKFKRVGGGLIE